MHHGLGHRRFSTGSRVVGRAAFKAPRVRTKVLPAHPLRPDHQHPYQPQHGHQTDVITSEQRSLLRGLLHGLRQRDLGAPTSPPALPSGQTKQARRVAVCRRRGGQPGRRCNADGQARDKATNAHKTRRPCQPVLDDHAAGREERAAVQRHPCAAPPAIRRSRGGPRTPVHRLPPPRQPLA